MVSLIHSAQSYLSLFCSKGDSRILGDFVENFSLFIFFLQNYLTLKTKRNYRKLTFPPRFRPWPGTSLVEWENFGQISRNRNKPHLQTRTDTLLLSTSVCDCVWWARGRQVKACLADQSGAAGGQTCFGRRPDRQLGHAWTHAESRDESDHPNPNPNTAQSIHPYTAR